MAFCIRCGIQNLVNAKFCCGCGKNIETIRNLPKTEAGMTSNSCPYCHNTFNQRQTVKLRKHAEICRHVCAAYISE